MVAADEGVGGIVAGREGDDVHDGGMDKLRWSRKQIIHIKVVYRVVNGQDIQDVLTLSQE